MANPVCAMHTTSYDAAGNVTNDFNNAYLYDGEGRLCAVQSLWTGAMTGYLYDADGARVAKGTLTGSGAATWNTACSGISGQGGWTFATAADYVLGPSGEQVTEMAVSGSTSSWKHTNAWAGGKILATYDSATTNTVFYLSDWLGTKRMEIGANGCASTYTSLPFGDGLTPVIPGCADVTEHHYTGKERDTESGNDYFGARYYASSMGRFMSPDWSAKEEPVPYAKLDDPQTLNLYVYVGNNPLSRFDPDGHCADHYDNGSCKVNVDPATGKAGAAAGKQLEGVLNKYDKAINGLNDKSKFDIKDSKGNVTGSLTGSEIKAVWNGTSFTVTSQTDFHNGGAGGGTGGTWTGDSFSGHSNLSPGAVSAYADAASARNEAPLTGLTTLTFHELGHETHFGEALTGRYPVTPTISWPRERGASSAGRRMGQTVGAPFDCSIPGGCQ